jgi:hypothetical protein
MTHMSAQTGIAPTPDVGDGAGARARAGDRTQGTVAAFDEERHTGRLLLDDGTPLDFPAAAFVASGLRRLRVGQRLRVERDAEGAIVLVTLLAFGRERVIPSS